jgi:hypothetical protein
MYMFRVPQIVQKKLLILRGVTLQQCIEEDAVAPTLAEQLYDRVPRRFASVETWPQSCNLRCWHCDLPIGDRPPCFVPLSLDLLGGEYCCNTLGVFNRWGCVIAYIDGAYADRAKRDHMRHLAKIFAGRMLGLAAMPPYIEPAPPRTQMQCYGGEKTADEYLGGIPI